MKAWDFAGDEVVFFIVAGIVGVIGAARWYWPLLFKWSRFARGRTPSRLLLILTPPIALGVLWGVMQRWADPLTVAGHLDYMVLFLAGGAAWLWVAAALMPLLGVNPRDDALGHHNPAAAVATAGAMLGVIAIYAGGNVGCGPTIWTTIVPAAAATALWLAGWLACELLSGATARAAEAIAIDHDLAAGIRHGGWLLASGLIFGRAIAGDWTSWDSTFADLRQAWPVLPLAVAAVIANRLLRPTPAQPQPSVWRAGVLPAGVFLLIALLNIAYLGRPEIGKHVITYEHYMRQTDGEL